MFVAMFFIDYSKNIELLVIGALWSWIDTVALWDKTKSIWDIEAYTVPLAAEWVMEQASEWMSAAECVSKEAVYSKWVSEWYKQRSKRTSQWPGSYVLLLGCSNPECVEVVSVALWSGTNKNRDVSTRPLARSFTRSLAPLTRSLAPDCSRRSRPPLCSLVCSLCSLHHL